MAATAPSTARVPGEWEPHERTWMCFPAGGYVGAEGEATAAAWAEVATAVADHEPVTMVVDPAREAMARRLLGAGVEVRVLPLDDCWMRDTGPTWTVGPAGALGAVAWTFNGWGQQAWASWDLDRDVGAAVARWSGVEAAPSPMVNEGGGMAHDGGGTVVLTETVQLDAGRNPAATAASVEAELARRLGVARCLWLPRGLAADYRPLGTRGHVDLVVAFTGPTSCVVHTQRQPGHPDAAVSQGAARLLGDAGYDVTALPAPAPGGELHDWSYVNFYVANGVVVVPTFADPATEGEALDALRAAFPGRALRCVDGRPLFAMGGGVHCITLQQPATTPPPTGEG